MRLRASSSSSFLEVRLLIISSLLLISESRGGFGGGGGGGTLDAVMVPVVDDWDAESIVDDAVGSRDDDLVRKLDGMMMEVDEDQSVLDE